jgi:hypothetical protein
MAITTQLSLEDMICLDGKVIKIFTLIIKDNELIKYKAYYGQGITELVDGSKVNRLLTLSRLLTGTTDESLSGIFTSKKQTHKFNTVMKSPSRSNDEYSLYLYVHVEFQDDLNLDTDSNSSILYKVHSRANIVRDKIRKLVNTVEIAICEQFSHVYSVSDSDSPSNKAVETLSFNPII